MIAGVMGYRCTEGCSIRDGTFDKICEKPYSVLHLRHRVTYRQTTYGLWTSFQPQRGATHGKSLAFNAIRYYSDHPIETLARSSTLEPFIARFIFVRSHNLNRESLRDCFELMVSVCLNFSKSYDGVEKAGTFKREALAADCNKAPAPLFIGIARQTCW